MAEDINKRFLIDVSVSDNGGLDNLRKSLQAVREEQTELLKRQNELARSGQGATQSFADNTKALRDNILQARNLTDQIDRLERQTSKANTTQKNYNKSLNDTTRDIQRAVVPANNFVTGLVDLANSGDDGASSFENLASGIGKAVNQALAFIATPIGAVLVAIAAVLQGLSFLFNEVSDAIQRNEQRSREWESILVPITARINTLRRNLGTLSESLLETARKLSDYSQEATSAEAQTGELDTKTKILNSSFLVFLATLPLINPIAKLVAAAYRSLIGSSEELNESIQRENDLLAARFQLLDDQRRINLEVARSESERANLTAIIYDRENESYEARGAAIERLKELLTEEQAAREGLLQRQIAILDEETSLQDRESQAYKDERSRLEIQLENLNRYYDGRLAVVNRYNTELIREQRRADSAEANRERARLRAEEVAQNKALRAARVAAQKELQIVRETANLRASLEASGFDNEFNGLQTYYALREQEIKNRLENELNLTDIARAQLQEQIGLLQRQQLSATRQLFADWNNQLLEAAGLSAEAQINDINARYDEAIRNLNSIQSPQRLLGESDESFKQRLDQYEKYLFDRNSLEIKLEEERARQIRDIRYQEEQRRRNEIATDLDILYEEDLDKFARNEELKLEIEERYLKERIERLRAAGLTSYKEQNELEEVFAQQRLNRLNQELYQTEKSAGAQYRARRNYLELELAAYEGNVTEQLRIQQELRALEEEFLLTRIEYYREWADAIISITNSVSEIFANNAKRELQQYKSDNKDKRNDLKQRLDAGLISQETYNRQVAAADEELAAKEAELAREQAKREKQLKLFEIAIETLTGIARAVSMSPLTFGLPWSAFVAATGSAQAAAVSSTPLPVAEKGLYIKGNRHSQGGTIVEAEDGEVIINRDSVRMFPNLLSEINRLGGGVSFTSPSVDGGYTARLLAAESGGPELSEELIGALKNANFIINIEQFNDVERSYLNAQAQGNFL